MEIKSLEAVDSDSEEVELVDDGSRDVVSWLSVVPANSGSKEVVMKLSVEVKSVNTSPFVLKLSEFMFVVVSKDDDPLVS